MIRWWIWYPSTNLIAVVILLANTAKAVSQTDTPTAFLPSSTHSFFGSIEAISFALILGIAIFSILTTIRAVQDRRRNHEVLRKRNDEIHSLRTRLDRTEAIIEADCDFYVIYSSSGGRIETVGTLQSISGTPHASSAILGFGNWLCPESASAIETAIDKLRLHGESFNLDVKTASGHYIEVRGRTVSGQAIIRFRDLIDNELEPARIKDMHATLIRDIEIIYSLFNTLDVPIWLRDGKQLLNWVNPAFATAVECDSAHTVIAQQKELLDTSARHSIQATHTNKEAFHQQLPVITAGDRRLYDVVDISTEYGGAGIAIDVSALQYAQKELARTIEFQNRTLDQLQSAVAIFGSDQTLRFHNEAYRALFQLDPPFLETKPKDGIILDRLRAARLLPEQADYRNWKTSILDAYRSVEPREDWWHLPDGRTLRVMTSPHVNGGVTYIFENVTEQLDLESRYNALIRVQGESLDNLSEGVIVFGPNGRLRLYNPAFASIWAFDKEQLDENQHVNEIFQHCNAIIGKDDSLDDLRLAITGLSEQRDPINGRIERSDGKINDYANIPLPDGATMVTFVDVTDSVAVERALTERNEALEEANKLKNTFIKHVSYELRSPLTNIIGFAQLLNKAKVGTLNDKQREYADHILTSSAALLAIVNDILDLATLDAGIMELELSDVNIAETVNAAVEGLQDRLQESSLTLVKDIQPDKGHFIADGKRVRQIIFNLMANAIAFSPDNSEVCLTVRRESEDIIFIVTDHGEGIPKDFLNVMFDRFESRHTPKRRRGAGLGLALVKAFAELHGGRIEINTSETGTSVTCYLPVTPKTAQTAAE